LITFSKNFLKVFNQNNTIENETILLHSSCPSIYVPSIVYVEACSLLKHESTSTSSVVRNIMNTLVDFKDWSKPNMNYSKIKHLFPNQCAAYVGKFKNLIFVSENAGLI